MNYLEDWLFWNLVSRFMVLRGWFVIISSIIGSRFHSLSPKFCHIPHHRSPFNSLGLEVISISKRKPTTKNLLKQNQKKSNRKKKEIDKKKHETQCRKQTNKRERAITSFTAVRMFILERCCSWYPTKLDTVRRKASGWRWGRDKEDEEGGGSRNQRQQIQLNIQRKTRKSKKEEQNWEENGGSYTENKPIILLKNVLPLKIRWMIKSGN